MKRYKYFSLIVFIFLMIGRSLFCENIESLIKEIFSVPSPTGYEENLAVKIKELLPAAVPVERDNLGSLYVYWGKDKFNTAFLTGMDEYGYFVSNITDEGYLTLDRAVRAPHPLFDSMFFGHPMLVYSEKGMVEGALALPSLHILSPERRRELESLFVLDNAYLDIGAKSRQEVIDRGVKFLDPVTPVTDITALSGEKMSGYSLGRKLCAALLLDLMLEASRQNLSQGNVVVWLAQSLFPVRGSRSPSSLGSLRAGKILAVSNLIFVDIYPCGLHPDDHVEIGKGPVLFSMEKIKTKTVLSVEKCAERASIVLQSADGFHSMLLPSHMGDSKECVCLCLPAKAAYTPSEIVSWNDVRDIQKLLLELWVGENLR